MNQAATVRVTRRLPDRVEQELASRHAAVLNTTDRPLDRVALADAMRDFDILVPTITDRIDADLLAIPGRVKLIANYGAGVDHIDLAAAQAAGIAVTNTPDALTEATAELAILLMLMAARRAGEGERELRAGEWTGWRPTHHIGSGLHGRVLGLVGFGRIAQATASKARGARHDDPLSQSLRCRSGSSRSLGREAGGYAGGTDGRRRRRVTPRSRRRGDAAHDQS